MTGQHAAPWADSGLREMDAAPYIGRHRAETEQEQWEREDRYHDRNDEPGWPGEDSHEGGPDDV